MIRIVIAAAGLCLAAVFFRAFWRTAVPDRGKTLVVIVNGMKFTPAVLQVHIGDRVVFQNHDLVPHTATARTGEVFDSGPLPAGREWTFIPALAGTTPYACLFHPTMAGSLIVTAP